MLEVDKGAFSIELFLYVNGRLVTWNDVETTQELERGYLPIPSVIWRYKCLNLRVTALAAGEPRATSLYGRYRIENTTADPQHVILFLAIRPFQVNPPWQSLNMFGGTTLINDLDFDGRTIWINEAKALVSLSTPDRFGAATFAQGPLADYLLEGRVPTRTTVSDSFGYASGALQYGLDLPLGGAQEVYLAIPFYDPKAAQITSELDQEPSTWWRQLFEEVTRSWEAELDRVDIHLPTGLEDITNTVKSTVAYILINRDGHAIQPGPRCYARSWIRDGALTSTALLEMGYPEERVDSLWKMGISGADLVIAAMGAGLRAFTGFSRVEYANGEEVPAEKFLAEVEGVVLEMLLEKIFGVTGSGVAAVDGPSRFYVLWRYAYKAAEMDAGEAIVFTYGQNVELDGQNGLSAGSRALVEKKKGKYRLRDFAERGDDEKLGMPRDDGKAAPLIDTLHRILWLVENEPRNLNSFLDEARPDRERLRLVAQALAGTALAGRKDDGPEHTVATTPAEQAALKKLVANWRALIDQRLAASEGILFDLGRK
jgi:Adenine-specific DNA methylase containing a Zn-ribbon